MVVGLLVRTALSMGIGRLQSPRILRILHRARLVHETRSGAPDHSVRIGRWDRDVANSEACPRADVEIRPGRTLQDSVGLAGDRISAARTLRALDDLKMHRSHIRASEIADSVGRAATVSATVATVTADFTITAMALAGGAETRGLAICGFWVTCSGWRWISGGSQSLLRGDFWRPVFSMPACRRSIRSTRMTILMAILTIPTAANTETPTAITTTANTTPPARCSIQRFAGDITPTKIPGAGSSIRGLNPRGGSRELAPGFFQAIERLSCSFELHLSRGRIWTNLLFQLQHQR
jgi:hypothetical protein